LLEVATIFLQLHGVTREGDGLVLDLERPFIHSHSDFLIGEPSFTIELPVMKAQIALLV
jgi:hypothetical protein